MIQAAIARMSGDKEYKIEFGIHRAERDATVAYYQPTNQNLVNHTGQLINLVFKDKADDLEARLIFGQMQEIETNLIEGRDQIYSAGFYIRKSYEIF